MANKFPADFWWGASTSAHQIEGDNHNDWTIWEQANAKRLARHGGDHPGAHDPANYISGQAAEHYQHYAADLSLAAGMGLNAYRFSVEWSRIEPHPGQFNQAALDHYRRVIQTAKRQGLEPFVCLWHWTLPPWLSQRGGWRKRATIKSFAAFVDRVVEEFGNEVKYWVTLNEPEVYAENVYQTGRWLEGRRNGFLYLWALRNLAAGHKRAYRIIKDAQPAAWVGIAKHNINFEAYHNTLINRLLVAYLNRLWNYQLLSWIRRHCDFIGLNYYFHSRLNLWQNKNDDERLSDMGWELYPKGLYELVMGAHRKYHKPIIVLEHGLADREDRERGWYITESLRFLQKALADGADVRGYFHWSLLDNFEWDQGFWPRFGLVAIDYKTQERSVRPSARLLSKIIKDGRV